MSEPARKFPRSAYDTTRGLAYFPRMLDKIRLYAAGSLPDDYHANLGEGFDGRCCRYLRVSYDDLRRRVMEGGTDEEVLDWCLRSGRDLNDEEVMIWTKFASKFGWRDLDGATARLEKFKAASGLAGRHDIVTFFDYYEVDEGRRL